MLADFHLHSEFSDDSKTPMEEQIAEAICLGLDEICFTDHVDYGIKLDWSDEREILWRNGNPLMNVNYPEYFGKLHRMQKTFGNRIMIRKGLEFGIQMHTISQFEKLFTEYQEELDFVLLSMHQVEDQEFWTQDFQRGRTQREYNLRYYEEIYSVMQNFKHYQVLAHLDLLSRYDPAGVYPYENVKEIIDEILRLAVRENKGIELNTSSWRYGLSDTQPCRTILKRYFELGGRLITLGSDAHTPEFVGAHMVEAKHILKDEIGFDRFCTWEKGQPTFHPL